MLFHLIALASAIPIHTGSSRWSPAGLLQQQHRSGGAGLHTDGHDPHLAHLCPPPPRPGRPHVAAQQVSAGLVSRLLLMLRRRGVGVGRSGRASISKRGPVGGHCLAASSSVLARSCPRLCDLGRHAAQPIDRLLEGGVRAMVRAVPCRSLPFPAVTRRGAAPCARSIRSSPGRPAGRLLRGVSWRSDGHSSRSGDRSPAEAESPDLARHTTEEPHQTPQPRLRLVPALYSATRCAARWSGGRRSGQAAAVGDR